MPRYALLFVSTIFAIGSIILSLSKGSVSVPLNQLLFSNYGEFNHFLLDLRITRTLTAFITGALLAMAGTLMQLLLQNPLADPYILGISSGASVITLLLMLLGVSESFLIGGAWLGSLSSMLLILLLTRQHGWQSQRLILAGIALACGLSACISCILVMTPASHLPNMLFWLSGDLNAVEFPWLGLIILIGGLIVCYLLAPGLNILARGDKEAHVLGLQVKRYKCMLYLLSSLLTATAVTMAGCIGFIGLLIPHITRMLNGYDHRWNVPLAVLCGGTLLTIADTCARLLFAPQQLPVGILIAFLGVPGFIWLLQK